MPGPYQKVYPPNSVMLFDGGKNSKYEPSLIEDNESPDALNVVYENGSVGTRGGMLKANSTSVGTFVCDGLYTRRDRSGSETMIAFHGGTARTYGASTFVTIASAQSVFTAGVRVGAAQTENHIFFGNGYVIPYKYNGTDWTRHGVYPPTSTSTVASQATGVLTGDYRYKVVFVNSQLVRGNPGPPTSTFAAASATLRITSIPVAPQSWGVSARELYRTVTSGSTWSLLTTINDNTTTQYDDNSPDSALTTQAPSDNGVPPKYSVIMYHQNRLWMNDLENPSFYWYTDSGEPYTVGALNFRVAGDDASDIVKGFGAYDNSVIIYCEKSIYITYLEDPSDDTTWRTVKAKSAYGTKSPFCVLDYNNKQLFVAMQNDKLAGFAALSGDTVEPSTTLLTVSTAGSEMKSDRIEPDVFDMVESQVSNFSGIVFKNKAYIAVTYGSGQTTNNRVYVMDFSASNMRKNQKEVWAPWTGWNVAQFTVYNGSLYFGSSSANGLVYRHDETIYNDDGSAIDSYAWTKEFSGSGQDTSLHKDFRYGSFLIDKAGDYFMNIGYRTDSDKGGANITQVNLNPGSSLWGTLVWGVDDWGGGTNQERYKFYLGGARGERIQFYFSNQNTANQRFKIHQGRFFYNVKSLLPR